MKRPYLNLFGKFVVAFISVGLLPVLFIGFYSGHLFREETYTMMKDSYQQVAVYGIHNLELLIEKYNTITKMLYSYNPDNSSLVRGVDGQGLARILKNKSNSVTEKLRKQNDIETFLRLICTSDSNICNVIFVDSDRTVYTFSRYDRRLIEDEALLKQFEHKDSAVWQNKLFLLATHTDNYFRSAQNRVFTIGRNYMDLSRIVGEEEILGTLYIDIDIKSIDNIFRNMEVYQKCEIVVQDTSGHLIYANPNCYANQNSLPTSKDVLLEITESSGKIGWQVLIRAEYQTAMRRISDLIRLINLIMGAILITLLMLSVAYSRVFSRPARFILAGMKQVEAGNFDVDIKVRNRDEMGELARGFNHMANRLKEYIETSFLTQLRWKEAELGALKAQIKPHFLYNSLEIIRMNAVANDDETTAELAMLLAEQMRYTLGQIGQMVSLSRELEITCGYFKFIELRFENNITCEIKVEKNLPAVQVLSLMIQPMVENAVLHGLKPKGYGHVEVSIERQENDLAIRVMDDGVGIDKETIAQISAMINQEYDVKLEQHVSLGIKNVHDRLRYKFGEPYGVSIDSEINVGTSITMLMPLIREEE